jgi:CRISPR/Cas system-associated exonuclease Cas4 (RecB family)
MYNIVMKSTLYITASEIGDYVYCKRSWWLRFQGLSEVTPAMRSGMIKHTSLQTFLMIFKRLLFTMIAIIILAFITLLISLFIN